MALSVATRNTVDGGQSLDGESLVRWSGLAAMMGAVLIGQAPLLHPEEDLAGMTSPIWVPTHFAFYLGYLLVQIALVGVLARQRHAAGRLGGVGFLVAFTGTGLTLMEGRDHIFGLPIMTAAGLQSTNPDELPGLWAFVLAAAVFSLGYILLSIATYRAGVLPRPAAVLLGVGAPLLAFSPPMPVEAVVLVGTALYAAGMFWLGYALLTGEGDPQSVPARLEVGSIATEHRS